MEKIATLLGLIFTDTGHRNALAGLEHRLGPLDRQQMRHWEGQTVAPHSGGSISSGPTHERQSCIKLRGQHVWSSYQCRILTGTEVT